MNNILVLVDYTETAMIAMKQAVSFAMKNDAKVTICHIATSGEDEMDLSAFAAMANSCGIKYDALTAEGDLFHEASAIVERHRPDLILVGTHGKQGVKQHLFGSAVYKLVSNLVAPTLVMNDNTPVADGGYKNVMMPVAPHADYMTKVEQTCRVLADDGTIVIFAIVKPGVALDDDTVANVERAKKYMDEQGVKWEYKEADANRFSVGYSQDTLDYAKENGMDLISIMANIANRNAHFGKMDKENMLLNETGIPVLCANS